MLSMVMLCYVYNVPIIFLTFLQTTDMFDFYKENLYQGMANCVTIGTASKHLSNVDKKGKYFLYAKTGTLTLSENIKDDRMLAVIITNRDLSQVTSPKDYKFYVVYFSFKQITSQCR